MEKIPQIQKNKKRKKKTNKRLLLLMGMLFIALLGVLFFRSPLSKVQEIAVSGNSTVTESEIIERSQIKKGMQFFNVNEEKVINSVKGLPAIKSVRLVKKFPGRIIIEVKENQRVAFLLDESGEIFPILENGKLLTYREWNNQFIDRPIVRSEFDKSLLPKLAEELIKVDQSTLSKISEIVHMPTDTDPYQVYLYMKDGNEVRSSLINFHRYISAYEPFVLGLEKEGVKKGIITLREGMWYSPYPGEVEPNDDGSS